MIAKYSIIGSDDTITMLENADGSWVLLEDYQSLRNKYEALLSEKSPVVNVCQTNE